MKFWNFIQNQTNANEVELRIEGEIISDDDAWIYEWFGIASASPNAFRTELKEHSGKDISVWIDSWGGDTTAAAGIYNALKEHKGKITVKIDGKAVSAASVIAMAGDEVKISPLGIMMIHNPWTGIRGEAKDMRHMADVLDEVKETLINAYQIKTKLSRKKISEMLDNETWMSPKTALAEGFVDEILYDGTDEGYNAQNSFIFSHVAIQNSASEGVRRFIEGYHRVNSGNLNPLSNEPKPPLSNEMNETSEECVCGSCNHGDNCQSSGAKCCICGNCKMADQCSKPGAEGCNCKECTMAQNNCCQTGSESCMCDTCTNMDCKKGHMEDGGDMTQNKIESKTQLLSLRRKQLENKSKEII